MSECRVCGQDFEDNEELNEHAASTKCGEYGVIDSLRSMGEAEVVVR